VLPRYRKGRIDRLTALRGGTNNAFTSHDSTAYYFSFASDRWEIALEIEADRMVHNTFARQELELERQVILEELKMEQDHPWEALRQAVERP
jgi:zinc protease